jgi:hypothetical protein
MRNDEVARTEAACGGRFMHVVPGIDPVRAEIVAGWCRLISATGKQAEPAGKVILGKLNGISRSESSANVSQE